MTSPPDHPLLTTLLDALRARQQITLVLVPDLGPHCGLTDLHDGVVFLDGRDDDARQHATLTHELIHLTCPECPEDDVERQAAERLVPLSDALAAQTSGRYDEVARRLHVDAQLVRARVRAVTARDERAG